MFSFYGFQIWLGSMAAWYLSMAIAAILLRRETKLGVILVVGSMAAAFGAGFGVIWHHWADQFFADRYVIYWSYILLSYLPLFLALSALTAWPRLRHAGFGFLIACVGGLQTYLSIGGFDQPMLFELAESEYDDEEARNFNIPDPEVIYPLQASLMVDQIDTLAEQTPGQVDLYALVGAGYPIQTVFQREVAAMQELLEDRFDAKGQVLRLGAQYDSPTGWPLLNRTNLSEGLAALADKMDTDEDIALVFLTSHGSPNRISTAFRGLTYNDLTAPELAVALETSGIQNTVIVISACYSGSFIGELKAPNRLILTASAADRNSFGCDDSNQFTDWGAAFFGEALTQTFDFIEAAEMAAETVAAREAEQGVTPSLPKIADGGGLDEVLNALTNRLSAQHRRQALRSDP